MSKVSLISLMGALTMLCLATITLYSITKIALSPCQPFITQFQSHPQALLSACLPQQQQQQQKQEEGAERKKEMSILIGIFSTASKLERRSLLRIVYAAQMKAVAPLPAIYSIMFVVGQPQTEEDGVLLRMEMEIHQDILLLDCPENMNSGKTYRFFSALSHPTPGHELKEYNYIMKADDDTYIRLANLGNSLLDLPREDLYYGYILPCKNMDPFRGYMAGMGYLLSWDLVTWIGNSSIPASNAIGTEDKLVGQWLQDGKKAKHRVNKKPLIYDHPEFGGECAHELIQETIFIHQIKTKKRWASVLSFFEGVNLTHININS